MRGLLALFGALLLGGCGSLHVQVDVVDPAYVDAFVEPSCPRDVTAAPLRCQLRIALTQSREALEAKYAAIEQLHRDFYEELRSSYLAIAQQKETAADVAFYEAAGDRVLAGFEREVAPRYEAFVERLADLDSEIRAAYRQLSLEERRDETVFEREPLGELLAARRALGKEVIDFFEADTRRKLAGLSEALADPEQATELEAALARKVDSATRLQNTGGVSIADLPDAYVVASAPDEVWEPRFNRAFGRGFFGNLNLAIKLDTLGHYTIKGLTFDPREVARVASKVTTQSLLLAAQIAGVPVGAVQGEDGIAALAGTSAELTQLQAETIEREATLRDRRDALLDIAGAILRERGRIRDADTRDAAAEAIDATYQAHKPRLKLGDGGSS